MSRDFDKAQEMVVASMEYVKILGFRIHRTEVQRDDWKQVAQSHADEMIKLRQHVDALKAERDAEREALGIQAAKEAGKVLGMVDGEGLRAAAKRVVKERDDWKSSFETRTKRMKAELAVVRDERDTLRKERDGLLTQVQDMRAKIEQRSKHGAWVKTNDGRTLYVRGYLVRTAPDREELYDGSICTPCDPPEATHDTPEGKAAAESAVKREPMPWETVRLVKVPTQEDYPMQSETWNPEWGQVGETQHVDEIRTNSRGTRVAELESGWQWPLSCIEIVEDAK